MKLVDELHTNQYDNLVTAIQGLRDKGFTADFDLKNNGFCIQGSGQMFPFEKCQIVEFHRFEGETNPSDMSIIYAIQTENGCKGIIIDAYGTYASPEIANFFRKAINS